MPFTIFDHARIPLPAGEAATLAGLRRALGRDAAAELDAFRADVARRAFEDGAFEAACWGCGAALTRAPVGLSCATCGVVVPVEERPALPRYRFGARVAAGAQGTVWKALYDPLDDVRAVKAIPLLDPAREGRIRAEARHTNALKHQRIPVVHDVLRDDDTVYIAMEWIDGQTLEDAPPPPVRAAVEWARQAAEGLGAAHARGLVHRDVKPGNLMRTADGAVKVVDFGLALPVTGAAGDVAGTPAYMAPEVARGEPATPRSDVWSLGATLQRLLTGRPPIERLPDESPAEYVARRGSAPAQAAGPPEVRAVLGRCLELDPARRYPTGAEVADDLARCLDGRPVEAFRAGLGLPGRWWYSLARHVDRNPVATIGGALLLVAAAAMTLLLAGWLRDLERLGHDRELLPRWRALEAARHETRRHDRPPAGAEAALRRVAADLDERLARRPGADAHHLRAVARRLLDDPAGAEQDARRALELDPGLAGAWPLLALLLLERGAADQDEVRRALARAGPDAGGPFDLRADPELGRVLEALSLRHLRGDAAGARASLLAAQEEAPSAEACLALASLATDPQERARWVQAGLRSAPGDVRLRRGATAPR